MAIDNTKNKKLGEMKDKFAATARYVKITISGCTADGAWASVIETQVWGK